MSNSTTFVLQEVIDDLVNSGKTLVEPLTKLNYFGRLIKNDELIQYTSHELSGYKGTDNIPSYRQTVANLMITYVDYQDEYFRELPVSWLDEPFQTGLKFLTIKEGIGTVEKFVKDVENNTTKLIAHPCPMEMLPFLQPAAKKLYGNEIIVVGARLTVAGHISIGVVNTVRAKLLALAMQVGEDFGFNIEISSFKKNQEINNQTINNFMKTEIINNGDGNITNTGSESSITATITISKGDKDQLNKALRKYGLDNTDIDELNGIVDEETPDFENKKLGTKTNTWIGNIVGKSLNGVGKIATTITGNILATLIKSYYGIHN